MPFIPDIIVWNPDTWRDDLVVYAALDIPDFDETEAQLKESMVRGRVEIGILITPQRIWLYHNNYHWIAAEAIRQIGEYDAHAFLRRPVPADKESFEDLVQRCLEGLLESRARDLEGDLGKDIREYVLPVLLEGEVRAAHPRFV